MEMTINKLPAPTWNRLGMNESRISNITIDAAWKAQIQVPNAAITRENTEIDWNSLNSGLGQDMDVLGASIEADSFHVENNRHRNEPVVYRLQYRDTHNYYNKVQIYAEENSRITVVERFTKKSPEEKNLAFRTRMIAGKNSKIRLVQVIALGEEQTLLSDTGCVCDENAQVELLQLFIGKGHVYNGVRTDLKGERADFQAQTGYLVQNTQLLDMNYIVNHIGKKTTSNVTADGTLKDAAHKVFRGSIDFKRGASGAKGTESEQVLLLGDDVINQTIPLILCAEEDVEGNHGAAIGELDEETLLYFAARGIDKKHAEDIMTRAKLELLTHKIDDEETKEFAEEQLSEVLTDDSL